MKRMDENEVIVWRNPPNVDENTELTTINQVKFMYIVEHLNYLFIFVNVFYVCI